MAIIALPVETTPFIGRDLELAALREMLADPACRLLTLIGPGGMGKTRLAQAALRELSGQFPDGGFFIPLESVTTPAQIPPAIASALGLRLSAAADLASELHCYLADMEALFVLDNFEQVLDGAELLARLLVEAPRLKLIITSRERLRLVEEWVFDVPGLEVPVDDHCENYADFSALQLFTAAARRVQPAFSLDDECASVVHICRLLDGMPLAIELAASWVRLLSASEIAAEITRGLDILETPARNMPPQHRQMRAVFDHSWNLLDDREQAIFARLCVFAGGFQAEAAEAVAGAARLDLAALLDKSWLRRAPDSGRFTIHELARQYGMERLIAREGSDRAARDQHAACYARYLDRQWSGLMSSAYKAAYQAIERELDNVRAAWHWAVQTLDAASLHLGLRSLWFFFDSGSRFGEGEQLFAAAVAAVRQAGPAHEGLLGRLLARQGALQFSLDNFPRAHAILAESLRLLEHHGLSEDSAFAQLELGMTLSFGDAGALTVPIAHIERARARFEALDSPFWTAYARYWLSLLQANIYVENRERTDLLTAAEGNLAAAEAGFRALAHPWGLASVGVMIASMAGFRGDYQQCWNAAQAMRDGFADIGVTWGVSQGLSSMAAAALKLGWAGELRRTAIEGLQMVLRYGLWNHALGLAHTLAEWRSQRGEEERAWELLGAMETERLRLGRSRDAWALPWLDRLDDPLPPALQAAVERGKARRFEPVLRELLAELEALPSAQAAAPGRHANDALQEPLTERELEILQLVAAGRSNREIASELYLAIGTVKAHVHNLTGKLDATNRTEAAAIARRLGLVSDAAK